MDRKLRNKSVVVMTPEQRLIAKRRANKRYRQKLENRIKKVFEVRKYRRRHPDAARASVEKWRANNPGWNSSTEQSRAARRKGGKYYQTYDERKMRKATKLLSAGILVRGSATIKVVSQESSQC